jgi:lipopolysaccharide export system permease protein
MSQALAPPAPGSPAPETHARGGEGSTRGRDRHPLGRTLARHVLRELAFPVLFTLVGLSVLAIAADLVAYSDLVLNRGFDRGDVAQIAMFRSLPMVGRVIPFSMLLGALIALGRMAADRELFAIAASGVTPSRLVTPVAVFGAVLALVNLAIVAVAEPWANRRLSEQIEASAQRSSGTVLRSGVVSEIGEWRIVAREVSSRGDHLRGVAIWVPSLRNTVFAKTGELIQAPEGAKEVRVHDGVVLQKGRKGPTYVAFDNMYTALEEQRGAGVQSAIDRLPSVTLRELARAIEAEADPELRRALESDWHRRLAVPAATLCFAVLAVPLALRPRRLSRSSGALAGIAAAIAFAALLQLSNGLVGAGFPVALAVWLPDLFLLVASAALLALPRTEGAARRLREWRRGAEPTATRRAHRWVLHRYLFSHFLETAALCFVALLVALVLVDVVDNLQWFTKYRSTLDEVVRFYAARVPLLVARVVPMALLVGASLTISQLGVSGELIGMRACGVSTLRMMLPLLLPCALMAIGYRSMVDEFVPRAAARATQIKRVEIKGQHSERVAFWSRDRDHLYQADLVDPFAGVAVGLTIYELDGEGLPTSRTDAPEARHVGEGTWHLRSPERVEVVSGSPRPAAADPIVRLGDDFLTQRDGAQLSVHELREEIAALDARGYDTTAYRVDLAAKFASPVACVLLPALALMLATYGPPFPTPAQILLASAALAIAHFVLSALAVSLGYRGTIPPVVAGWGATAISAVALVYLVIDRVRRAGGVLRRTG